MSIINDAHTRDEDTATPLEPIPIEPPLPMPRERKTLGKARRSEVPRSSHAEWKPPADRASPIELLEESNRSRLQHLAAIRYGRMLVSPFAFLRGSPTVMAHDLAKSPVSGIEVQACGDAHLMNFGVFASPERNLLFDLNDFDETLPGPWEWDLKRLSTSCVVAGRSHGIRERDCGDAAGLPRDSIARECTNTAICVCLTSGILVSMPRLCSMWSAADRGRSWQKI